MMTARYRAFLSYSHRDAAVARRVHGALEGWRVDAGLVGRATPVGAVPAPDLPRLLMPRLVADRGHLLSRFEDHLQPSRGLGTA